jgi:hypothetical protein
LYVFYFAAIDANFTGKEGEDLDEDFGEEAQGQSVIRCKRIYNF